MRDSEFVSQFFPVDLGQEALAAVPSVPTWVVVPEFWGGPTPECPLDVEKKKN